MLACIGEVFESSEEVTGCVFSSRRQQTYRIAIWTRHASGQEAKTLSIGRQLREIMNLNSNTHITYQSHGAHRDAAPLHKA
jgi:hypothetical protein